jgi:hypothetical protein
VLEHEGKLQGTFAYIFNVFDALAGYLRDVKQPVDAHNFNEHSIRFDPLRQLEVKKHMPGRKRKEN